MLLKKWHWVNGNKKIRRLIWESNQWHWHSDYKTTQPLNYIYIIFTIGISKLTINTCVHVTNIEIVHWHISMPLNCVLILFKCAFIHRLTCSKFQCIIIHSQTHWWCITETLYLNYTFPILSWNISRLLREVWLWLTYLIIVTTADETKYYNNKTIRGTCQK